MEQKCPVGSAWRALQPVTGQGCGGCSRGAGSQGGFPDRERTRKPARPRASLVHRSPKPTHSSLHPQPAARSADQLAAPRQFGSQAVDVGDGFHRESEHRVKARCHLRRLRLQRARIARRDTRPRQLTPAFACAGWQSRFDFPLFYTIPCCRRRQPARLQIIEYFEY